MKAVGFFCVVALIAAQSTAMAAGVQYTRDRTATLVNKDVGDERWAITYQFSDGRVTGNVTIQEQEAPVFIDCDRQSVENGVGTFACYSADACPEEPCPPSEWTFQSTPQVPIDFFLPPGDPPSSCSSWTARLDRQDTEGSSCDLTLVVDNRACADAQVDFRTVLLNCSGEQINLTSRFEAVSVAARQSVDFPLGDIERCVNDDAVVELNIGGVRKKTNTVNCASSCEQAGSACDRNADCCSYRCEGTGEDTFCATRRPCFLNGSECEISADCCSNKCEGTEDGNFCVETSACRSLGDTCGDEIGECCLGSACEGVDDESFCVATDCRLIGQSCGDEIGECCTGNCEGTESENFCVR